ncbi:bifunctional 2-C-methyl-D-erythritol 4-phosphate cytidylyltransferase/2-C-methyl-D-erythritol 2,4-cyclodiphosphate synthase [Pelagibacterium sp. 26DY04]|uniref:bifunctional 2-C-methyl-D-erythritol 4-phosphate cytidylyltransferase/2-C-methyl-D-erythritol 2,4-cyclodiphosphate synthase n=1 Tax=Pelagibacterium sp. 26DY04 TaxID=2967130 RepID=UPI002814A58E|nr:bifunctional 2-C-methyl-D-erythritol 4-phosphate cytidylyltransferase/2-C-methyl-D-erythritol 2,4-cyclodiphosphate synthase [Pelagibacterium sp. 26DY04]WMT85217.1 bifunctional 2-C-methyl-D-erythritol 4-phosphate cytidylyltransferase/2-C-methyl-D-erythritol 2,4-cyclodiphosphate synthase [Pelagibacterium sp. 26DY04]
MTQFRTIVALVVAAGRGERAGGDGTPKQYRPIAGVPLLSRTLSALLAAPQIDRVIPVIGADQGDLFAGLGLSDPRLSAPVPGGETRQVSVLKGLEALAGDPPDIVLIHDGARPFIDSTLIDNVIAALDGADGALPVTLVTDTIKRSTDGKTVGGTEDRTQLFAAQTPQGFHFAPIYDAHRRAIAMSDGFTDDAAIAEWAGLSVALAQGDSRNIKVTLPSDFERAERIVGKENTMETRVGSGFDVHAFTEGDAVILGNIAIPHSAKLKGHSDADVVLHALSDALYGALADGDIGKHFPPSESEWKDADSAIFLEHAVSLVRQRGGRVVHLDVTIICERPKIGPHVVAMRERIAQIANISPSRVAVKATTSERLGFTGREEGIAAQAIATIEIPQDHS